MPVLRNPKHEAFAQALAKGKTQEEAYVEAGYKANRGNASTLTTKQYISDRVADLLGRGAKRAEVTVESILRELAEDRALARELKQTGAAVAATMGRAKVAGIIIERREVTTLAAEMTPDELERRIEQLAASDARREARVVDPPRGAGTKETTH